MVTRDPSARTQPLQAATIPGKASGVPLLRRPRRRGEDEDDADEDDEDGDDADEEDDDDEDDDSIALTWYLPTIFLPNEGL